MYRGTTPKLQLSNEAAYLSLYIPGCRNQLNHNFKVEYCDIPKRIIKLIQLMVICYKINGEANASSYFFLLDFPKKF